MQSMDIHIFIHSAYLHKAPLLLQVLSIDKLSDGRSTTSILGAHSFTMETHIHIYAMDCKTHQWISFQRISDHLSTHNRLCMEL